MKNIVITGGTSGVGLSIAEALSIDNYVIIIGRHKEKGEASARRLGKSVTFIQADLSMPHDVNRLQNHLKETIDKIDVLILSAGVFPNNGRENITQNLMSHYNVAMKVAPLLQSGKLLLVSGNPKAVNMVPICEKQTNYLERAAWVVTHKTLLMIYLSEKLKIYHIKVNSFFPGDVQSNLMPYTRNLTNKEVPVARHLVFEPSVNQKSGAFFDSHGNEVQLNERKYNFVAAESVLSAYINTTY